MGRKSTGTVRIIGGAWRGRKLPVVNLPGLRPSGDRARETLFNWLAPHLPGAHCADLFAGTGALGFEAASRGAESVELVESNPRAVANLRDCKQMLDAGQTTVHAGDVFAWLKASPGEFDIMFADPPFEADVQQKLVDAVVNAHCLAPGGFVYLESAVSASSLVTPSSWAPWREKRIGEVLMRVFRSSTESR